MYHKYFIKKISTELLMNKLQVEEELQKQNTDVNLKRIKATAEYSGLKRQKRQEK
jgi:hypothetical protein